MIPKLFVLEITYAITDAEGDRLELLTWEVGDDEAQALLRFNNGFKGRKVIGHRVLAGNLRPIPVLTRGSGRSIR